MTEEVQERQVPNIAQLEILIDGFLKTHPVTPSELVGFLTLKVIEYKENFRMAVEGAIKQGQQEMDNARRQGKKAS